MFAFKSLKEMSIRVLLIAVISFNALAPTTIAQAKQETASSTAVTRLAVSDNGYTAPVFTHPQPRTVERTDLDVQAASSSPESGGVSLDENTPPLEPDAQGARQLRRTMFTPSETLYGSGVLPASQSARSGRTFNTVSSDLLPQGEVECEIYTGSTLTGRQEGRDLCVPGPLTISNATLIGTNVYAESTLTISESTFSATSYVMTSGGPLTATGVTVEHSSLYTTNGYPLTITTGTFSNYAWAYTDGGAMDLSNIISDGSYFWTGNGNSLGGALTITNGTFEESRIQTYGGDLTITNAPLIKGSYVNTGNYGMNLYGAMNLSNVISESGVFIGGILTIENSRFYDANAVNSMSGGESIAIGVTIEGGSSLSVVEGGSLTINNGTIKEGVVASDGPLTMIDSTVSSYSLVSSRDLLTITNSTFLDSDLESSTIYAEDALTIANSTLVGDYAGVYGYVASSQNAIHNPSFNHSAILRSTISMYGEATLSSAGTLTATNSTLWGSTIGSDTNLYLYNTILAHDSGCGHAVTGGSHNLIDSSSASACGLTNGIDGNIVGSDAGLGRLMREYSSASGVYLYYFELKSTSPAIDAGDNSICAATPINNKSQNGATRPVGRRCDIGAYEAAPVVDDDETVSTCSQDKCIAASGGTFKSVGGPINTRTGGYDYSMEDISIPTSAGALTFRRDYASQSISRPTALGPGWTHNLATRLILPNDPEGKAETILLKLYSANRFAFHENADGIYDPAPGLMASLVRQAGPPVRFIVTDARQNIYTFDENGVIQSYKDSIGNTWEYTYTDGRLTQVSADGGSRYLSLHYDPQGRIDKVSDHTGRFVTYHYNASGDLDYAIDLANQTWTYQYSNHLMTRVLAPGNVTVERTEYYPDGRAWKQYNGEDDLVVELTYNTDGTTTVTDSSGTHTLTYDARGTLITDSNQLGGATGKSYGVHFRPETITDAGGNTTSLEWSTNGANLTKVTDAKGGVTEIDYDALNNPVQIVDPLDHPTTYEYNGKLLTRSVDALSGETTYTYTPEGFLASTTDPMGSTTSYTYDAHGQRTSMTLRQAQGGADPQGETWNYTYDSLGRLVDTTDPLERVQHNEYDNAGRLIRTTQNYDVSRAPNAENQYNIVTEYGYDLRGNQVSVTDTYGHTTQYVYDDANRLVQTIDPAGNPTTNTYNAAGQLVTTTDALGRSTQYGYDEVGRQTSVTDALTHATSTAYNPDGTVASTTDALGRVTSYTYDELQRVTTISGPAGVVTNEYDANGNLITASGPGGHVVHYEYDALGRLIIQRDALNGVTENFYNAGGQLIQTIDPRGKATTYQYTSGRLMSVTDALGNVTRYEYDDLGRRTAVVNAKSGRTEYTYDALDRVVSVKDPLGHITSTQYDALGRALSRTDANGKTTTFAYDDLGRLTGQTDAMGGVTSFAYDVVGNRLSVTDPKSHTSSTVYDALNRPVTSTDALGNATHTVYDAVGQVIQATDANDRTTTFAYTPSGQQSSITDPLGHITSYAYDAAGRRTSVTDANNIATAYEYDALDRLTAVVENFKAGQAATVDTNVRTTYTYDANGNRLSITDGNGHATTFVYDDLNRLTSESDALGHSWAYEYDGLGNRIAMTDAKGQRTEYVYDAAGRLTNLDYPGSDTDVSFAYDAAGRRTSMTDGLGNTTWLYDDLNRPTTITDPFSATVGYSYDAVGNRTGLTYPNGATVSYAYDAANRLTDVNSQSSTVSYQYDAIGRLLKALRPNGVDSTYTYDAGGRLTALQHATTGNALSTFNYTYDNVGNRTRAVESVVLPAPSARDSSTRQKDVAPAAPKTEPPVETTPQAPAPLSAEEDARTSDRSRPDAGERISESTAGYSVSLLHMNGADAATTFTDELGKTWTANGNAQIDTAQSVFGGASALFDGAGDYITTPDSDDFNLSNVDWTMEFRVRFNAINGTAINLVSQYQDNNNWMDVWLNSGRLYFGHKAGGATTAQFSAGVSFTTNTWYHIVIERNGNTPRIAVNGAFLTVTEATPISGKTLSNLSAPLTLGAYNGSGSLNGWIDEFRFSKGIARWTSNFTPPAAEYLFFLLPDAATLVSPSGDTGNLSPAYTWNAVSDATWYYLWVDGPSGNVIKTWYSAAQANCNETTCSVTPTVTLSLGAHKWWVQTWNEEGYGPWSARMDFNVVNPALPGKAILSSPSGNITTTTPAYTWSAVSNATWYYLYVNGPSGNVIQQWYEASAVCTNLTCSVTPTVPLSLGAHKWWIQTWNSAGYGPWSDEMSFTVGQVPTVTIDYDYDPLYRLTAADYANATNDYYHYTYDAVGNRLTQSSMVNGLSSTDAYLYDNANRLTSVDGVNYTWDNNGNLLNDGVNAYTYNSANQLKTMTGPSVAANYAYNGFGDRLQEIADGQTTTFTMDLNAGLTQALSDGTYTYLYGNGRLAQTQGSTAEYFLGDALGSVRQLTNSTGAVTYAGAYDPYGVMRQTSGTSQTVYGYTGEYTDSYIKLIYLRSRWYDPQTGRFPTRDSWQGDYNRPLSLNRWNYTKSNPVNYTDPSGMITEGQADEADKIINSLRIHYNVIVQKDWGYRETIVYTVPEPISTGCHWEDGNWRSLRELRLVKQTVAKIAQKMGSESKFRSAMGTTTITRLDMQGYAMTVPQPINSLTGDLRIPNLLFDYTDIYAKYILTHELGHVWDFEKNYSLSKGLMQALGTWICDQNGGNCHWLPYAAHSVDPITNETVWERPAGISLSCTGNPPLDCPEPYALGYGLSGQQPWESIFRYYEIMPGIEDWAESFANYVYPSYYASQRLSGLVPGGVRENYVRKQMDSLP